MFVYGGSYKFLKGCVLFTNNYDEPDKMDHNLKSQVMTTNVWVEQVRT
uniref:Uncharacterized protein n=2 Tax=Timema TaxID=61471 RepID=A0A7R9G710_TIMSH|nr:unnamed protein product [Timema douglasi]CAD7269479.1 unnamed protein product [Timema shepardi]